MSPSTPASTITPEPSLSRSWSADLAQRLGVGDVGARGEHLDAADVARLGQRDRAAAARGELAPQLLDLLLLLALLGLQLGDARGDLEAAPRLSSVAGLAQLVLEACAR